MTDEERAQAIARFEGAAQGFGKIVQAMIPPGLNMDPAELRVNPTTQIAPSAWRVGEDLTARVAALEAVLTEAVARPWGGMEDGPQFCRYCGRVWSDQHAPDCVTQRAAALGIAVDDRLPWE
jgi:hypothetical protein